MATDWMQEFRDRKAEHEAAVAHYQDVAATWRDSSWAERTDALDAELAAAFDARNAASTAQEQAWIQVKLHGGSGQK